MKAIQITKFGGPEVMTYVELPDPVPADNQSLIEVSAIGINYADTHQTENSYLSPQHLPMIPGLEVVGRISSGQRVLAAVDGGGYAQQALAHTDSLIPIPDEISDGQALSMLVQGTTAFHTLKTVGHLKPGETVVIHAAAGGVGVIAIQLAKHWGATVIAVVSDSQEKLELVRSLGADHIVTTGPDLAARLLTANNGKAIDLVLEMVGGSTFEDSFAVLAPFGRLVTYGMASRVAPRPISSGELLHGSKTISGFWLAHCFGHKELLGDVIAELFGLIESGVVKPVIGQTFPLSEAKQAHLEMLARKTTGKVVLDPAR